MLPDYLVRLRETASRYDKNDRNDQSPTVGPETTPLVVNVVSVVTPTRRFGIGRRYLIGGVVPGTIHLPPPGFWDWMTLAGYPKAAVVTIEGERLIVADLFRFFKDGVLDVVGVAPAVTPEPNDKYDITTEGQPIVPDACCEVPERIPARYGGKPFCGNCLEAWPEVES